MSDSITTRLAGLGLALPPLHSSAGNYVSRVRTGSLLYISGQISIADDDGVEGRLGDTLVTADGVRAARIAALNLLAQIDAAVDGERARVKRLLRIGVFIAAAPAFTEHSQVGNGASDLLVAVLGEAGRHVRTSVGVASLPAGAAVEIDAIVELEP
jgi:enamine deaminase RidA (YjgF/YER057c/UK114 family)